MSKNKAILADDMGTGKTLQSITAFKTLIDEGILINCLVICPNTLIKNWEKEIIQWSPELQYSIIDPEYKDKNIYWKESLKKTNVIICSYEQIKIAPKFIFDMKHKLIIADEAHKIRKQSSGINQQFSKLKTEFDNAISGKLYLLFVTTIHLQLIASIKGIPKPSYVEKKRNAKALEYNKLKSSSLTKPK